MNKIMIMLNHNVLLEPITSYRSNRSNIILIKLTNTNYYLKYPKQAKVISTNLKSELQPGDIVVYEKMLPEEEELFSYTINGNKYLILKEKQIFAIVYG